MGVMLKVWAGYVREMAKITVAPEDYKEERIKLQIKELQEKLSEKKELLETIKQEGPN